MLTINEKMALEAAAGGRVTAIAVAQLVLAAAGEMTWEPGFEGAIVLHTTDGVTNVSLFEFGEDVTEIFWVGSIELYPQMQYTALLPSFHVFEITDGTLGLNFCDAGEARTFSASVQALVGVKSGAAAGSGTPLMSRPPPRPSKPPGPGLNDGGESAHRRPPAPPPPAGEANTVLPAPRRGPAPPPPALVRKPSDTLSRSAGNMPVAAVPSTPTLSRAAVSTAAIPSTPTVPHQSSSGDPSTATAASATPVAAVRASAATTSSPAATRSRAQTSSSSSGTSLMSSVSGFFKSLTRKSAVQDDIVISGPESFEHRSHVGWSEETGFDTKNLPNEWKHLLKSAGLKKKDLQDGETAMFVMEHISAALAADGGPPPPTPPSSSEGSGLSPRRAAPLPPPTPTTARRAQPPPPTGNTSYSPPTGAAPRPPRAPVVISPDAPPPPPPPHWPEEDSGGGGGGGGPPPPPPPGPDMAAVQRQFSTNSLADQLATVKLKKGDVKTSGELPKLDPNKAEGLIGSLAAALQTRRMAIHVDAADDNNDDDDEWSD